MNRRFRFRPFARLNGRLDKLETRNSQMHESLASVQGSLATLQETVASAHAALTSVHESLASIWKSYSELDTRAERSDTALEAARTAILEQLGTLREEVARREASAAEALATAFRENTDKAQQAQASSDELTRTETEKVTGALARLRTDFLGGQKGGLAQVASTLSKQQLEMRKRVVKGEQQLKRIERLVDVAVARHGDELGQELTLAAQARRRALVDVRQPLVLISQIGRSGGRLLGQLFDCHPQCHVHPYELHIGHPDEKRDWPELDLSATPAEWWDVLSEPPVERYFLDGLKGGSAQNPETLPFLVVPALTREIFEDLAAQSRIESQRDVLDVYMTAFFNGWLDNQNLYGAEKRWVVGFVPGMSTSAASRAGFFRDYPDGRLISIVRDPKGWYASAHARNPSVGEAAEGAQQWRESAEAQLAAKEEHGDLVLLLRFEQLVTDTRAAMETVMSFLGLDLPDIALEPTFNGMPIKANSSFEVDHYGILQEPADRGETLDAEVAREIDGLLGELYETVLSATSPAQRQPSRTA